VVKASPVLLLILLLGLALRFLFILFSDHILHPDEVFQTLEQGYRLVYGYGLVPWEFQVGVRSWLAPGIVAGWLWLLKSVGVTLPRVYIPIMQSFFIILSLSLIVSSYTLVKRVSGSTRLALVSAFAVAVWYELIYFASRPLTEVLATYSLIGALALLLNATSQRGLGWGTFLTGLGLVLRPQYSLLLPGYIWVQYRYGRVKATFLSWGLGLGLPIALSGALDWLTWGSWFYSTWQYVYLNLFKGINQVFGAEPWYFYLMTLLITSSGLYLLGVGVPENYRWLGGLVGVVLVGHSLIPHKEHRFIFLVIPLFLILSVMGGYRILTVLLKNQRLVLAMLLFSLIGVSGLGMMDHLLGQSQVYYPMLRRGPRLQFFKQLAEIDDVCGLWDTTVDWVVTGGYYYLGKPIPLYAKSNPPPRLEMVNYVIAFEKPSGDRNEWREVNSSGGVQLYKRDGQCLEDVTYNYNRYIPAVQAVLGSH
jgi:hypothetical protein